MSDTLQAAKEYLALGWSVIPLEPGGKLPPEITPGGKRFSWKPYQTRQASERELTGWLQRWRRCNLGIVTGQVSGVIVLDIDSPEAAAWVEMQGVPLTPTVKTGKGQHLFFRHPGGTVRNFASKVVAGLDLRGDGGYVCAPPSVHETGTVYQWEIGPDTPLADPPGWLLDLIRGDTPAPAQQHNVNGRHPYVEAAVNSEIGRLARTTEGVRNDQLFQTAASLGELVGGGYLNRGELERELLGVALQIGLGEREATATIQSGLETGIKQPRQIPEQTQPAPGAINLTDLGNGRRLVRLHGGDLRYCHKWGRWLVWDGQRWAIDETGAIQRRARDVVRTIYNEAASAATDEVRKGIARWAMSSEARHRLVSMVEMARDEEGIPVQPAELDRDPWLLNVANGTLDLRSGELQPHHRDDLLTKMLAVHFDPAATCPMWITFLREVLPNPDLRAFLARAVGYSLTGITNEQCLFFAHGGGRNGKSTFIETLRLLLSDYAQKMPSESLMIGRRNPGGATPDVARLPGARLVVAAELEEGRRLAESLVKDLTGNDHMTARFLRQEYFEFTPTFKLFLVGNHRPGIKGTDEAIWRRIHLIPFEVTIPKDQVDRDLPHKLAQELPGILAWAVRGCLDWQQDGLQVPKLVEDATGQYRHDQDEIGRFLDECCVLGDNTTATKGALYDEYVRWGGYLKKRRFGHHIKERGFANSRGTGNVAQWEGVGLLTGVT